ncbi:disease resistance protein RPS6-like isoform X2 [Raphanus sativus]|uniref:Disease resistance protein RPS6-like isoform X2 n=1 Tax=Raphanus sativus TaxID=3726 RepID=A0A9W3C4G7_RAPSA|nr:disease resistance protein RPS6-like isoform X2 [Raphanus sativus]
MAPSSSSCSRNWVYDVFPSFSGKDVRVAFLSHFLKELDRKLITVFKDNEIERSQSLDPELVQAIRDSKIAVVVLSKNYASSSWCLNELLEILRCKKKLGQLVIPIFYGLDPSHVRKQTGGFGKIFERTCKNRAREQIKKWRKALTGVANTLGYHSKNWDNEAKMIEDITNDISCKLKLTPPKDFDDFVGMEDHMAEMRSRLQLDSEEEVKMVGIWGPSGIDRAFVTKSMQVYRRANPDDYNMRLDLQRNFLSEILGKKNIRIDHLSAVRDRLKRRKVLIVLDDLDDQVVLDTLAGQTHWFGRGSRIIVITKDRQLLRANGIDCVYKVGLPSVDLALEMLSRYAFRQSRPLPGFTDLAAEVANHVGYLPLGLKALGSYLRGRDRESWIMHGLRKGLNRKIEEALRVDYEGLGSRKDKAIFRLIACVLNNVETNDIKLLLEDSDLDVCTGLENLLDHSLIHERWDVVQMHCLLEEMGKEMARTQSKNPIKREFLVDSKDICDVLSGNNVAEKLSGISLNLAESEGFNIDKNAFVRMTNLLFLRIYEDSLKLDKQCRLHLQEGLNYLPPNLRLLCWDSYPLEYLPSSFRGEDLVVLKMRNSRLEKLWDDVPSLTYLKDMDLAGSKNLEELPDLSMATNLMTLDLTNCKKLVVLPSSIGSLYRLQKLNLSGCTLLEEIIPNGINLESLYRLDLGGCTRFRFFPNISRNISFLILNQTAIEEVPWWIENFTKLICLEMWECKKLTYISPNISKLKVLEKADFSNCEALTKASWVDRSSHTKLPVLNFINCFNLDQESLIQRSVFKYLILPGQQVPSYFTNQATGNTLAIPLLQSSLSQQFLRFRVCLVVDAEKPKRTENGTVTSSSWVCCHFTCKDGIPFGYSDCRIDIDLRRQIDNHLVIFDSCFPLSKLSDPLLELNYDQVDTEIHFTSDSLFKIRRCGIRLSQTDQSCIPISLAHVQEGYKRKATSDLGNDTEETERSRKRVRVTNQW